MWLGDDGVADRDVEVTRLTPKLISEKLDYGLVRDDILSVESGPVELKWNMTDEEFEKYEKAASSLLESNGEFRQESLRRFLRKNKIGVYSLDEAVCLVKYDSLKLKSRSRTDVRCHHIMASERYDKFKYSSLKDVIICPTVFQDFIPLRVIERINPLSANFTDLYFFVLNNLSCSAPWSFIVVAFNLAPVNPLVIDKWNESDSVLVREK